MKINNKIFVSSIWIGLSTVFLSGCITPSYIKPETSQFYLSSEDAKQYKDLNDLYDNFILPKLGGSFRTVSKYGDVPFNDDKAIEIAAKRVCRSSLDIEVEDYLSTYTCDSPNKTMIRTMLFKAKDGRGYVDIRNYFTGDERGREVYEENKSTNSQANRDAYARCVQSAGQYSNGFQGVARINSCSKYLK